MPIKTKIVKITSNGETELLRAENELVIKNMSIVYLNDSGSKTISIYLKPAPDSLTKGTLIYKASISKSGLYTGNIYLAQNNQLTIEAFDIDQTANDTIDVIIQYIEF